MLRGCQGLHFSILVLKVVSLLWQTARRRSLAVWVREKILQLGPTFIKLGQLSSTRSDLFPAEIVEELAKLQVILCTCRIL